MAPDAWQNPGVTKIPLPLRAGDKKAHLHPLRSACVQYERKPPIGFIDLLPQRNVDRRTAGQGIKIRETADPREILIIMIVLHVYMIITAITL